jgi:hypothetical protein
MKEREDLRQNLKTRHNQTLELEASLGIKIKVPRQHRSNKSNHTVPNGVSNLLRRQTETLKNANNTMKILENTRIGSRESTRQQETFRIDSKMVKNNNYIMTGGKDITPSQVSPRSS